MIYLYVFPDSQSVERSSLPPEDEDLENCFKGNCGIIKIDEWLGVPIFFVCQPERQPLYEDEVHYEYTASWKAVDERATVG